VWVEQYFFILKQLSADCQKYEEDMDISAVIKSCKLVIGPYWSTCSSVLGSLCDMFFGKISGMQYYSM
jgi:hypothetical protein